MPTDRSQTTDSVSYELNAVANLSDVLGPGVKGPDPDRLANHDDESAAFAARLREEAGQAKK